jgi:hypothetical protein
MSGYKIQQEKNVRIVSTVSGESCPQLLVLFVTSFPSTQREIDLKMFVILRGREGQGEGRRGGGERSIDKRRSVRLQERFRPSSSRRSVVLLKRFKCIKPSSCRAQVYPLFPPTRPCGHALPCRCGCVAPTGTCLPPARPWIGVGSTVRSETKWTAAACPRHKMCRERIGSLSGENMISKTCRSVVSRTRPSVPWTGFTFFCQGSSAFPKEYWIEDLKFVFEYTSFLSAKPTFGA